jgi:hypothetical protein
MQMIVNKEMANRMDDSNSITACPRGELRSDSGLDATVVMGWKKNEADKEMAGSARHKRSRPENRPWIKSYQPILNCAPRLNRLA